MTDDGYRYYETDAGTYFRVPRGEVLGTDILTDGKWVPIDPDDFGGDPQPFMSKVGSGEAGEIEKDAVPGI